jgi:hypothetical protein
MNIKLLTLATICTATLVATVPLIDDHNPVIAGATGIKESTQKTTISLRARELNTPHILSISAVPGSTELRGEVELNGRRLLSLGNRGAEINLAPMLTQGQNTIKIRGSYYPPDASIKIEFFGEGTQINQQTSGNGILDQVISINVM